MLTITQATAILSILMAFGVPQATVDKVHDILIPPQIVENTVQSVPITPVPVEQTPIVPNQPVQFGSVSEAPVCDDTPTITITPFLNFGNHQTILSTPVVLDSSRFTGNGQDSTVWLAVDIHSACNSKWTFSESGPGAAPLKNQPADTYPQGSTRFFSEAGANIDAQEPGSYEALITATDGSTTATSSFSVITQ